MLSTEIEMDEEAIRVPYKPLFDEIRKNNGFVDLRGKPHLAKKIVEGTSSVALRRLLISLAKKESRIFSIGCDLGTSFFALDNEPFCAGGYIQVMHASYAKMTPDDYGYYSNAVTDFLEPLSEGHFWSLRYELAPVEFLLDRYNDMTGSLRIWFRAFAKTDTESLCSREKLISDIGAALTSSLLTGLLEGSSHISEIRR
jgi:hypothetical protein